MALPLALGLGGCREDGTGTGDDGSATDATTDGGPADSTESGGFPAPLLDDCIDDGAAGDHQFTCDGLTYDVSIPQMCLSRACGLIVDVHGRTVSGRIQDSNTMMRARGAERGYVVVQPNANPPVPNSAWTGAEDDRVLDFIERTIEAFHVDVDRVHFSGFSQGGFMTWRMACRDTGVFASFAVASACGEALGNPDCSFTGSEAPSRAVPILYTHGTADSIVPFDCAEPRRGAIVAHHGLGAGESVSDGSSHTWTRYPGEGGMVLEFITHDYRAVAPELVGHCIVGGQDPGTEPGQLFPISCAEASPEFVWGAAVIDFFEAHPRGG